MHRKRKISYEDLQVSINEISEKFDIVNVDLRTVFLAIKLASSYHYAYFDSLVLAAALENNCTKLYSEDMHNTHIIEKQLALPNPFS